MAIQKILTVPNPILRQKSKPVGKIDKKIKNLVAQMVQFLKTGAEGKQMGLGLSAPQIGKLLRIIVVWSKSSRRCLPMINPKIIWKSKRTRLGIPESKNPYEGCLSVPNIWGKVRRHSVIKVLYQTPANQRVIRKFRGLNGVVIQHEIDHLEGILFIDRILEQKGKLYKLVKDKEGKDVFVEVEFK